MRPVWKRKRYQEEGGAGRRPAAPGGRFGPTLATVVAHKVCEGVKKNRAAENYGSDMEPSGKELKSPRRYSALAGEEAG